MAGAGRKSAESMRQNHATPPTYPVSYKTVMWVAAVLVAIILFIYAPVRHYGFLSFDDPEYVSENAQVIRGLTGQGVLWAFTTGHASNWHPMTWLSHMLDVQMYGMNAGRHHFTSLLLHLANALLLFGILYRTTGAWRRSAMVAVLFAAHPLHVESVAWVAERKDVLSTLFWMLTMHAYVSYVGKPRLGRYLAVVAVFALGLMSKPMLVTLPLVLLLLDVWPLDRVRFEAGQRQVWLRMVREKIPLFMLAAASMIVTVIAQWRGGAVQNFEVAPLYQRAANALVSYVAYLGQMVWPRNLAAYYPYAPLSLWLVAASAVGLHRRVRLRDSVFPKPPLPFCGMALVRVHTGSGHRVDSGGRASKGGPLYLYSAHWSVHNRGVGDCDSPRTLAISQRCAPSRGVHSGLRPGRRGSEPGPILGERSCIMGTRCADDV